MITDWLVINCIKDDWADFDMSLKETIRQATDSSED